MAINVLSQSLSLADGPSIDAFDRLRVSQPVALLDCKLTSGISAARWISATANGATIAPSHQCAADLACTAASGSSAIFQTKQRGIYQSGRSLLILATFNFNVAGNGTGNIRKRVGMFDENDGIYLEQNGVDVRFVLRSNTTGTPSDTNFALKSNWNIDKFDGSGPSGITLDFTKTQIMIADLEWLGVGRVRAGFVVNGIIYYAHQFLNTNILAAPYMANPNLPCRYECVQTSIANTGTLTAICCTILSEGGFDTISRLTGINTGTNGRSNLGAVRDEVLAIRLGTNFIRKGMLVPENLSLLQTSQAFMWELVMNATPSGTVGAGTWVSINDSLAEYNIGRTATAGFTGGYTLSSGYVSSSVDSIAVDLNTVLAVAQADLTPSSDVLSLLVTTLNTSDQTYHGSLTWRSLR
jgi:hypothetical protein